MVNIRIVTVGNVYFLDIKKIQNWKSGLFKIYEEIKKYPLNARADTFDWGYSDENLEKNLPQIKQIDAQSEEDRNADIYVYVLNVRLEYNYFSRILSNNRILISYYEIREILDANYIPQENFLISLLYSYALMFLSKEKSELTMHDEESIAHDVTEGCLFDMRGIKSDVIYSCVSPKICDECISSLHKKKLSFDIVNTAKSEIKRIKRKPYYRIILFFREYPIISLVITTLSALLLNIFSNFIYDWMTT